MKKLIEKAQNDKTTLTLTILISFLLGAIIGFLFVPIKNGINITIASNNVGCDLNGDEEDDEDMI